MDIIRAYDETFMAYANLLAEKGWGRTGINPLVGAVIVKNGKIIGQGFHRKLGESHAEVVALSQAGAEAKSATLYVNLEPCTCFGHTPPCVDAIIKAGIKRVVIGAIDPNPRVDGQGIKYLSEAGIEVVKNILKDWADNLNRWYYKFIKESLPYVILKIAVSEDMRLSGYPQKYITSVPARRYLHSLRSQTGAVMIGINTLLIDNPYLSDRLVNRFNPVRIVIDPHLKIPADAHFLIPDARRIIITSKNSSQEKVKKISDQGVEFIFLDGYDYPLPEILKFLVRSKIGAVMVEGGARLFNQFINTGSYDELYLFVAPKIIGRGIQLKLDQNLLSGITPEKIGGDKLYHVYRNN